MNKILFSILMSFHFILMGETAQAAARPVPAPRPYHSLYKHLYEGLNKDERAYLDGYFKKFKYSSQSLEEINKLWAVFEEKIPNMDKKGLVEDFLKPLESSSDEWRIILISYFRFILLDLRISKGNPDRGIIRQVMRELDDFSDYRREGDKIALPHDYYTELGPAIVNFVNASSEESYDIMPSLYHIFFYLNDNFGRRKPRALKEGGVEKIVLLLDFITRLSTDADHVIDRMALFDIMHKKKYETQRISRLLETIKEFLRLCGREDISPMRLALSFVEPLSDYERSNLFPKYWYRDYPLLMDLDEEKRNEIALNAAQKFKESDLASSAPDSYEKAARQAVLSLSNSYQEIVGKYNLPKKK